MLGFVLECCLGLTFATGLIFFITFKNIKNIFEEQSVILLKQNAKKIYIIYILKISLKNLVGPLPPLSNNSFVPNINIICDCIFLTFDSLYIYIYIYLTILSSHYAIPTSHMTVFLSQLMVPLFFSWF